MSKAEEEKADFAPQPKPEPAPLPKIKPKKNRTSLLWKLLSNHFLTSSEERKEFWQFVKEKVLK